MGSKFPACPTVDRRDVHHKRISDFGVFSCEDGFGTQEQIMELPFIRTIATTEFVADLSPVGFSKFTKAPDRFLKVRDAVVTAFGRRLDVNGSSHPNSAKRSGRHSSLATRECAPN